jgi:hypothetical protein
MFNQIAQYPGWAKLSFSWVPSRKYVPNQKSTSTPYQVTSHQSWVLEVYGKFFNNDVNIIGEYTIDQESDNSNEYYIDGLISS